MQKRLEHLLREAVINGASDIHFTQRYDDVELEMRINGRMKTIKSLPMDRQLIHYLQYLADLDVGNMLKPQTGQFELEIDGKVLSLRFALISKMNFCSAVLRILNHDLQLDARHLSFLESQNRLFKRFTEMDNGLILFSGPTGSGKTTTLYTLLKGIEGKKIYSIEDPIEIYYDEFVQLEVNEKAGFDYKEGIRQILRHDPDIILIGEIRDENAARMAIRAANTGHLVFSSIHAPSSALCLSRMNELGVSHQQLRECLKGVVNQRLISFKNRKKIVFYETMDEDELNYLYEYHRPSSGFISIKRQLDALTAHE